MISAAIETIPLSPVKGIYYIGQYGTSGYASAARGYLYHYFSLGIPITWEPLYFDNSKMEDDDQYNIIVKSLIDKKISHYDIVIVHSTPDLWPKFRKEKGSIFNGKIVIGYCTWETNKLPNNWVQCINTTVNEVWVPSQYNKQCFVDSGVQPIIRVVPHIFLPNQIYPKSQYKLKNSITDEPIEGSDAYTFYTIGELNARKGIDDTIKAFCEAFTSDDRVRLLLKVHYKDYSKENRFKCESMIKKIIDSYVDHPPIICLFDNMKNKDILALHALGDCYIGLTKSEGFGLTIFDAFHYGRKVIATGYGGHLDFLGQNYSGLVKYTLGPVSGMDSSNYGSDQQWAIPDVEHAKELMKNVYEICV